jgi:hypothetical protein
MQVLYFQWYCISPFLDPALCVTVILAGTDIKTACRGRIFGIYQKLRMVEKDERSSPPSHPFNE